MRLLFTLLLMLSVSAAVYSQTFVGARAGMNYSKVNGIGSTNGNFDWEEGYHAGLFLYRNIGDRLYLQPELLFNTRGYNYTRLYSTDKIVAGDTVQLNQNTKLVYLDVPLLARLQLGKIYFEAGPQFGIHLSGKSSNVHELNRNGEVIYVHSRRDARNIMEPVDIGFIAGLGYQTDAGIGIGFRYNQGFREVVRRVNWEKNVLVQASVSYMLGYHAYSKSERIKASHPSNELEEYFDPAKARKAKKAGYKINARQNVMRVSIVKVGESARPEVRFEFNSIGSHTPSNILLSGSSGVEEQSPLFIGFRDVQFPFKGAARYTVQAAMGAGAVEGNLEFEIQEPGIWRVNIQTQ